MLRLSLLTFALSSFVGCKSEPTPAPVDAPDPTAAEPPPVEGGEAPDEAPDQDGPAEGAEGEDEAEADAGAGPAPQCGGFAGRPCPEAMNCVDDPSDECDPKQGGADCGGICVEAQCDDPRRQYKSRDPSICARMKFGCDEGQSYFGDACGCGCLNPA